MASRQPPIDHVDPAPEQSQDIAGRVDLRFPRRTFLSGTTTLALTALLPEPTFANQPPQTPPTMPLLMAQLGHSRGVTSVGISSDGRFVLTGSADKTARLWDTSTGRLIRIFEGHLNFVESVAFSPDNQFVLTGSQDKTARLWEIATGKVIRTFEGDSGEVLSVCFSPDGRFSLTGSSDNRAHLWEIATGKEIRTFEGHSGTVASVCFSPGGQFILTGSDDGTARLWEVATGKEIQTFEGHANAVNSVCFSPDGRLALTGSDDKTARLWETSTGKVIRTFEGHRDHVASVCFSPDGSLILTGSEEGTAWLWDTASGKMIRTFPEHSGGVYAVCFSPEGRYVLTGGRDYTACLSEVATGKAIRIFEGFASTVHSACFAPNGRFVLTANGEEVACLWDISTGKMIRTFQKQSDKVTAICFSPDSRFCVTGGIYNTVLLWEVSTGKLIREFESVSESPHWINSVYVSPDGRSLVTGSSDDRVRLWEVATGKVIRTFEGHTGLVRSVCFSPNGRLILTGSDDGTARLWEVATGKAIRVFDRGVSSVASVRFSPDGRFILMGTSDGTAYLYEVATDKTVQILEGHSSVVSSVCFSLNGRFIATGSYDKTARLWEVSTGKTLQVFQGHTASIESVCFSPNGQFVLTGSDDATARLWSIAAGTELAALISFKDGAWAVVAPDGRFDCTDLDEIRGLHWIVPDEPLRPLPLEIFQRQYYEPGLLKRLWNGEKFPPLPSLVRLNRIQPTVQVEAATLSPNGTATVHIAVASVTAGENSSGAVDLRLFRDGQLVGWKEGRLENGRLTFSGIQLPNQSGIKSVKFSAYVFNTALVKSETVRKELTLPARTRATPAPRHATVICMGVDASEGAGLTLRFAVNDANALADSVTRHLRAQGRYTEVVTLRLLAPRNSTAVTATKADLRAVLARLAGVTPSPGDTARLSKIPGAGKLRKATPDDLVLLSFSGHGYAGDKGIFYLLPYDVGPGAGMSPERLSRCISSDDLSQWLRGVDAGDIAFIVDACHSAQAVEGDGTFKPGPMGSRGLGQLAYDKRMLLLAATQAANVALESGNLGHGLLTYALVREGLEASQGTSGATGKRLTLSSWLRYGEKRVPELWEMVRAGKGRIARGVAPESASPVAAEKRRDLQQPTLFDFSKKAGTERDPLL